MPTYVQKQSENITCIHFHFCDYLDMHVCVCVGGVKVCKCVLH